MTRARGKKSSSKPLAAFAGRSSIRLWAPAACFLAVLAASCSQSAPGDEPQTATRQPETPENRIVATASVLISEEPERPTPAIDSIEISPSTIVVDLGEAIQLSAQAFEAAGQPLSEVELIWATVDPRAGSVSREGKFQAGTTPGAFENSISVTGIQNTPDGIRFDSVFASVTIVGQVQRAELANLVIVPDDPTLFKRQIYRLRALGFDENGLVIPGVSLVWSLNDARLGRLNEIGYLTVEGDEGIYPEGVSVTGIWAGVRMLASTDINVVSAPEADDILNVHALPQRFFLESGDRLQLRAVALNGLGELVAGTELRWTMADPRAGTIDGAGDFIAGGEPGIYTEAVKLEAVVPGERGFVRATDFASVVVSQKRTSGLLHAVAVVPETVILPQGGRATLAAHAVDEAGEPAENVVTSWEVLKSGVGEISALGGFKAGEAPGIYSEALRLSVRQRVGDEDITRTKTVNVVITGTLFRAGVHPDLVVVAPGRTVHFSSTGWDENDVALPGLVVIWSVTDDLIGTIDAFGNFTAGREAGLYEDAIRAEIVQRLPD